MLYRHLSELVFACMNKSCACIYTYVLSVFMFLIGVDSLNQKLLNRHASYFFIPLAAQLVNEDAPICRKMIAEAVKILLRKVCKKYFSKDFQNSCGQVCFLLIR